MISGRLSSPCLMLCSFTFFVFINSITVQSQNVTQYSIEEFLNNTTYVGASFSSDNSKILVGSDKSGTLNAWEVPLNNDEPTQLTFSDSSSIFTIGYLPDNQRFLYTKDDDGNELYHIHVRDSDGSSIDLTPGENVRANFIGWSANKNEFYITTNERDPRYFDLYKVTSENLDRTLLYQNDAPHVISAVSPDARYVALTHIRSNSDTNIYIYDLKQENKKLITEHEGDIKFTPQTFSPDGRNLYYLTNNNHEFDYLVRQNIATGRTETVRKYDWSIIHSQLSPRGTYLALIINEDSRFKLEVLNTKTNEVQSVQGLSNASVMPFSVANLNTLDFTEDENSIAFYASNSRMPNDLFIHDLGSNEKPKKLVNSLHQNLDPAHIAVGEIKRFTSYDGLEIPGILYKPLNAGPDNKVPALVSVHGGPGGQAIIFYQSLIAYLVNHGYAVYAINQRGSRGYGKTFLQMDDQKHGQADLDDIVASKQMLIDTGFINPGKIGVMGASFGGYLTLAALTFRPEVFEVGVDLFGISNLYRTLQNRPESWAALKEWAKKEFGDLDDVEFFKKKSPLFYADNIVKPLIVLQGANDPRVLKVESDDIVEAVRSNGVPVEYLVFEDEGHGIYKKDNQIEGYKKIREFLDANLKGARPSDTHSGDTNE